MNKKIVIIAVISVLVLAIIGTMIAMLTPLFKTEGKGNTENIKTYKVAFYSLGKLLETQEVKDGAGAKPPVPELVIGKLFKGWDKELSCIKSDLEVNAVFEELGESQNVFSVDNVYIKNGEEVVVNVDLRGKIELATADFTVNYDNKKLKLKEVKFADAGIEHNSLPEKGQVKCSLMAVENITGEVDCLQLVFTKTKEDFSKCDITVSVDNASKIQKDKIVDAPFKTVNGSVTVIN